MNRVKNNLLDNALAALVGAAILVFLLYSESRYPQLVISYLIVFLSIGNLSGIDKNVNVSVLINYPLDIREVFDVLSLKFVVTNLLLGSCFIFAGKFFLQYSIYQWLNNLCAITYLALVVFFLLEVIVRKKLDLDLIFTLVAAIIMAIGLLGLTLLYRFSHPLLVVLSIAAIVLYHGWITGILSSASLSSIYEIQESTS